MPRGKKASTSVKKKAVRPAKARATKPAGKTRRTAAKSSGGAETRQHTESQAAGDISASLDRLKTSRTARKSRSKSHRKPRARTGTMAKLLEKVGLHL